MIVLGIDIGVQGAIAVLDGDGSIIDVHDMPVLNDGPAGRRAVNAPLLVGIIGKWRNHRPEHAFVERVGARPGEGAVGAFSFGRARGVIEGVLASAGVPVRLITPAGWKRSVGLATGKNKDASRAEAIRRWPGNADLFKRAKDDGRADACLIAIAGLYGPWR